MAVRIRLRRMGSTKRPFYRIVVADSRMPRDGRFIEVIGYYNPIVNPEEIQVDEEKAYKWLQNGAQPTDTVRSLLKKAGVWRKWGLLKRGVDISQLKSMEPATPDVPLAKEEKDTAVKEEEKDTPGEEKKGDTPDTVEEKIAKQEEGDAAEKKEDT